MAARRAEDDSDLLRTAPTALYGIFILALIAAIYMARDFLLPVVFAFLIALTFRPAIRRLSRYGVPAWLAAVGFASFLVISAVLAAYLASVPVAGWLAHAPELQRA